MPATGVLLCASLLAAVVGADASAAAHAARQAARPEPDPAGDFAMLAQQAPRTCAEQEPPAAQAIGWRAEAAQCVWQNRLRMRRWSSADGAQSGACVSPQARWWTWARAARGGALAPPQAWRAAWMAQSLADDSSAEKRIVIIRRLDGGQWSATEWRWNPSPRAATRRWQQGRWALLAQRAQALRQQAEPGAGAPAMRSLRAVWETNLGTRAGEIIGDIWQWPADGLCLRVDAVGLGEQQLHIPYSADDSRLEQRAAMQLQLARRYPKASWLTSFRMIRPPPQAAGGAKFYAVWLENTVVKGQLWMPAKGDGPLLRLRIDSTLPAAPDGPGAAAAAAHANAVIERELTGIAARWADEHE